MPACGKLHEVQPKGSRDADAGCHEQACEAPTPDTAASTATGTGRAAPSGEAGAMPNQGSQPLTVDQIIASIPRGNPGEVVPMPDDDAVDFFTDKKIHEVDLTVNPDDLALIDSDPAAETYVNADVTVDGESLGSVGLRYKGSAGAFIAPCTAAQRPGQARGPKVGKCSMKLDIDRVNTEQRLHGLKKLNLHAMGRDPSMLREQLGYSLFREMGVATPRTTYSRVVINGELEGLFLGVEQIDGRFTRARFTEGGKGNVYKEVWPNTLDGSRYRAALETNEDDDNTSVMSIVGLAMAAQFQPQLAVNWLDREYMLHYIAVDRMILNDDGPFRWYCTGNVPIDFGTGWNHNYFWYESPVGTRVWLIPWDLDLTFAGAARTRIDRDWRDNSSCDCHYAEVNEPASPQRPPACDRLTGEVADWLDDYDAAVDKFIAGPFAADAVDQKLMRWMDLIAPIVKEAAGVNSAPTESGWQDSVSTLREAIEHSRETRGHWPGL